MQCEIVETKTWCTKNYYHHNTSVNGVSSFILLLLFFILLFYLDKTHLWTLKNNLPLNASKCAVVHFQGIAVIASLIII